MSNLYQHRLLGGLVWWIGGVWEIGWRGWGVQVRDLRRWQIGGYSIYRRVSFKVGHYGVLINYGEAARPK